MVNQHEHNIACDTDTINSLNAKLPTLFPDQPQLDLAHKRVHSASHRSLQWKNRNHKSAQQPPATPADYAVLQAKFMELQAMMNTFQNSNVSSCNKNKTRVSKYPSVSVSYSHCANPARLHPKHTRVKRHN